jgi:hypothetical protein
MAYRTVEFDADDLLKLITHYSEGAVPLDAEVRNVQISARLQRWVCLIVESKDWAGTPFEQGSGYNQTQPFFFDYEGKRTQIVDHLQDPVFWNEAGAIEAPKRQ